MQFGLVLPNTFDVRVLAGLAREAEEVGWDGVFVWDGISCGDPPLPMYDAWIILAAIALQTERVRIGTMVTALSRRRPWKVARETMTLDHLSGGRLILPVGLGATDCAEFARVNEITDRKARARRLDESLDILAGLWSGKPFSYQGEHYQVQEVTFNPPVVQSPRIPVWVVGAWRRSKSLERALRWDGILPSKTNADGTPGVMQPADVWELQAYIASHRRESTPYDIVMEGDTPGADRVHAIDLVSSYADAGVTWWLEAVWKLAEEGGGVDAMRERILQGPPR